MHILGAISEFERARIAERVRAGLARVRRERRRLGRPPVQISADAVESVKGLPVREAARRLPVDCSPREPLVTGTRGVQHRGSGPQPRAAHQPRDATAADPSPAGRQRLLHPRTPICPAARVKHLMDLLEQDPVLLPTSTVATRLPCVVARPCHAIGGRKSSLKCVSQKPQFRRGYFRLELLGISAFVSAKEGVSKTAVSDTGQRCTLRRGASILRGGESETHIRRAAPNSTSPTMSTG
jgi:hypothetical protein